MKHVVRVAPGKKLKLHDIDADAQGGFKGKDDPRVQIELKSRIERLAQYQERLYAEQKRSLLVVLQAMDAGGKDPTLRIMDPWTGLLTYMPIADLNQTDTVFVCWYETSPSWSDDMFKIMKAMSTR